MRILLVVFVIASLFSCKNDGVLSSSSQTVESVKKMRMIHPDSLKVPSACELISQATIKKLLKTGVFPITVKDASNPEQKGLHSCFFRWDDPALNFAGIMLQVNSNQVYEHQQDNITAFVQGLLKDGSMEVDANSPNKFKEFMIGDIKGAYSYKMSRFHWNLGPNYGFMLAFNVPLSEDDMVDIATEIAEEVNETLATKIK